MKKRLLITTLVLAMLMIMANVSSVFADSDAREPYGYTVKVYSGEQGEFSGGRTVIEKSVQPGETVDISQMASDAGYKVTNDEYYCRGFRESGHDNDESPSLQAFKVTEDVSYEAAYGIRGNMVKYTIMYLDEDGASLRSADEYYGMIGDKPVVSYKYIEGYQPNAYNLTKTLTANESENVFGFSYTENGEAEEEEDNDNNNNNNANNNGGANNANANNANANNANANNPAGDANANADGNNAPANVVDLDDGATPLAEGADGAEGDGTSDLADSETPKAGISKAAIGGIAALVVAAAGIVAFLAKRRRDAEDEDEDEDEDE